MLALALLGRPHESLVRARLAAAVAWTGALLSPERLAVAVAVASVRLGVLLPRARA
jgi:hypothetical protein